MPIEKKREFYKCKSRYVTVDKIETWELTRNRVGKLQINYCSVSQPFIYNGTSNLTHQAPHEKIVHNAIDV